MSAPKLAPPRAHTPGPWHMLREEQRSYNSQTGAPVTRINFWITSNPADEYSRIALIAHGSLSPESDAAILSAGPDMLEALVTCLEFVDSGGLGEGVNASAKATLEKYLSQAIAKARRV